MRSQGGSPEPVGATPVPISPRTRNLLVLAGFAAAILLLVWAPSLLLLLFGGAVLALVISIPVGILSRIVPRAVAILLVVLSLVAALVVALVFLVPILIRESTELIAALPAFAAGAETWVAALLQPLAERGLLPATPEEILSGGREGLIGTAQSVANSAFGRVIGLVTGAFSAFLQLFGILFVAVYLVADIRRFQAAYLRAVPRPYRSDAQLLWSDLGSSLSRYLTGLLISLSIQGILATILLALMGVPYAVLLGLWTAVTGILPYVGAFLAAIPAVIIAFFVSPLTALLTAGAYLLINQIEGNFLTPRIQGDAVRVHPLLVFLAVFTGGEVGGLAGAALAVPVLAILRVLFDFFAARLRVVDPAVITAKILP